MLTFYCLGHSLYGFPFPTKQSHYPLQVNYVAGAALTPALPQLHGLVLVGRLRFHVAVVVWVVWSESLTQPPAFLPR